MTAPDQPPPDLIERLQQVLSRGDEPSASMAVDVNEMFRAGQERIWQLCRRLTRDEELARDLTQEALLTAHRKLADFNGSSSFETWVYGIARNLCMNRLRKRGEVLTEDGVLDQHDPGVSVLAAMTRSEREDLVQRVSATLEPDEQEAVHLRYVEGLPRKQIEAVLKMAPGQARVLLQRSKRKLQRAIRAELEALGHGSSFLRTRS